MRQAYDYWQDQPGSILSRLRTRIDAAGHRWGSECHSYRGTNLEQPEAETPHVLLIFHIREHEQLSCGPRQPRQKSEDMPETQGLLSRSASEPQSHNEDRCGADSRIIPYNGKATQEPRVVTKRSKLDLGGKMKRMRARQFVARARSLPTRTILTPLTRQSRTLDTTPPNTPDTR